MKLVWLARAIATRNAQIDYIARDNTTADLKQGNRIAEQIEALKQHPELGRLGRVRGTRELVISRTPFIVVYRVKATRVEILRVLHGAQQWPKENSAPPTRPRDGENRSGRADGALRLPKLGDRQMEENMVRSIVSPRLLLVGGGTVASCPGCWPSSGWRGRWW